MAHEQPRYTTIIGNGVDEVYGGERMSMTKFPLLVLLLATAVPATSIAAPHTLSSRQLTEGSLLGQIRSTAQLQRAFHAQTPLLARASERLGLTHADFVAVRQAIELGHARYVVVPRHLDAMAGEHGGVPFVDRDVVIPANVHGWEVDLAKSDGTLRVFVPNACGNMSYLRVPKRYNVAAAHYAAPVPTPRTAQPVAAALPPAPPVTPTPAAIATSAPVAVGAPSPSTPAAAHHLGWLPLLVVPLIFALAGHGGGSTTSSAPAPIHTICPGAAIIVRP
jgi:hypothetical protein